jgi:hypothetical protein
MLLTEKYRPHTPSDFVGLDKAKRICAKLADNPFDSSWLFVGASGTGKTTLERFKGRRNPRGWNYCFYDVAHIFDRLTRAAPGAVPLFGQSGDFVATLSVTRVRFQMDGLCGTIGMLGYNSTAWSFSIRVVERDRGFFSETGYRSFTCAALGAGESSDVKAWCLGHVRHWWNGEGGKAHKYVLPSVRPLTVRPALPVAQDEDETETEAEAETEELRDCSTCGVNLSQLDEYGECCESGEEYCPECYAVHEAHCAECLPFDEPDDDGRTAIGNGYRSQPVSTTSTQLSLF